MPKFFAKIRSKRKKTEAQSTSQPQKPIRKPLHVEIYRDEIVHPTHIPLQSKGTSSSTPTEEVKRPSRLSLKEQSIAVSPSRKSPKESPVAADKDTETMDKKKQRDEKVLAQKLAKERERTARAAAALDNKGNALFEKGNFDKAMLCYSKALKLKRRTFDSVLDEVDDLVDQDTNSKKLSKADRQVLVSMATSINNIGYLRQRSGEATPEETMAAYQKSLSIKRKILGNNDLSVGKTLNNIGSVYYLTSNFKGALKAYQEGIAIMRENLGEYDPDVATVMSNIGDVYLASGEDDNSLANYRAALNIRYANFGRHDPRVVRLLEKIARIEIGDRMTPKGEDADKSQLEENALLELGMLPLPKEFKALHGQVEEDMEFLDKRAVDMIQERAGILKGLRDFSSSDSSHGQIIQKKSSDDNSININIRELPNDQFSGVKKAQTPRTAQRTMAQEHVSYRLAKIRSLRQTMSDEKDGLVDLDEQSTASSASYYSRNSSIKLTQGIDSLRTLRLDEEEKVATPKAVLAFY